MKAGEEHFKHSTLRVFITVVQFLVLARVTLSSSLEATFDNGKTVQLSC